MLPTLASFGMSGTNLARVGNIKYYRSGKMDVVLIDTDGNEITNDKGDKVTRELRVSDIPKEMLKNAYMEQYKGTKRNYETTETGSVAPTNGLYENPTKPKTTAGLY